MTWTGPLHFPTIAGQWHRVHYRDEEAWGFSKTHPIIIHNGTSNFETQRDYDYTFLPLWLYGNPKQRFWPSTYPVEQSHWNIIKMSTQSSTALNSISLCNISIVCSFVLLLPMAVHFVSVLIVEFFVLKLFTKS